ncbi:hypothetical protein EDB85DRAFT_1900754 [Lactarius pseudohatsudake]|nr:hypothetical protein EDB85DRAFT_1900754 [Lactarius pseudohatsudake]
MGAMVFFVVVGAVHAGKTSLYNTVNMSCGWPEAAPHVETLASELHSRRLPRRSDICVSTPQATNRVYQSRSNIRGSGSARKARSAAARVEERDKVLPRATPNTKGTQARGPTAVPYACARSRCISRSTITTSTREGVYGTSGNIDSVKSGAYQELEAPKYKSNSDSATCTRMPAARSQLGNSIKHSRRRLQTRSNVRDASGSTAMRDEDITSPSTAAIAPVSRELSRLAQRFSTVLEIKSNIFRLHKLRATSATSR